MDDGAAARALPKYQATAESLPSQFAVFFLNAQMEGMKDVEVVRFERDRVDNASEQTFNTLDARLKPFPMYELRLFKGSQFKRLFAFVYIDGGFRFVITPDFTDGRMYGKKSSGAQATDHTLVARIKQGGAVQAAQLRHRVPPEYPEVARRELLAGTVRCTRRLAPMAP